MEQSVDEGGLEVAQSGLEVGEPVWTHPISPDPYYQDDQEKGDQRRRICGLLPATFALTVALFAVVILAGIGGGLGIMLGINNAKKNASPTSDPAAQQNKITPTSPSNSRTPTTSGSAPSGNSATTIPSTHKTEPVVSNSKSITVHTVTTTMSTSPITPDSTGIPFPSPTVGTLPLNCPAITNTNQTITLRTKSWNFSITCGRDFSVEHDIMAFTTYTLKDCAQACASYNSHAGQDDCKGVVFAADFAATAKHEFETCFLKEWGNGTRNYVGNNRLAAAMLV